MSAKTKTSDVVLLHGLGGSREDWDGVRVLLPRSLHATAIDLPGSPGGPKPLDGYDPASLASWLSAALFRDLVTKVILVGHSVGARAAGELAAAQPGRVEALVLVSPLGATAYSLTEKLKWKAMSRRAVHQNAAARSKRGAAGRGLRRDRAGATPVRGRARDGGPPQRRP